MLNPSTAVVVYRENLRVCYNIKLSCLVSIIKNVEATETAKILVHPAFP